MTPKCGLLNNQSSCLVQLSVLTCTICYLNCSSENDNHPCCNRCHAYGVQHNTVVIVRSSIMMRLIDTASAFNTLVASCLVIDTSTITSYAKVVRRLRVPNCYSTTNKNQNYNSPQHFSSSTGYTTPLKYTIQHVDASGWGGRNFQAV